jgi:hypothetical protein
MRFPDSSPPDGLLVDVTLTNGSSFPAYFDGSQWWVGVPDDSNDIPVVNSYVASWQYSEG